MAQQSFAKRRRNSTGGTAEGMVNERLSYAQVIRPDVSSMSDSQKLDFLVDKVCLLESWTGKIPQVVTRLNEAYGIIDNMTCEMTVLKDQLCEQNLRLVDAEARSRRNNLLFSNIPEIDHETDEDCEAALFRFFKEHLRVDDTDSNNIVFQGVHRLGRKKPGVAANGQAWRPRQIIAGFRDYKARQDILLRAKHLKGTHFSINQDFPPEIRTARGQLWDDYKRARSEKLKAKIAFPAKLFVEGQVVRDLFPMWGNWAKSSTPTQYDDRAASQEPPRSGAPMQVAMADLIGAAPFKPRNNPANPNNAPRPQHAPVPNYSTHPSGTASSTGARPNTADTLAPYATDTRLPLPQRPVPPPRPRHHHAVSHRPSMAQPHAISQQPFPLHEGSPSRGFTVNATGRPGSPGHGAQQLELRSPVLEQVADPETRAADHVQPAQDKPPPEDSTLRSADSPQEPISSVISSGMLATITPL